jgi:hypothetical protein
MNQPRAVSGRTRDTSSGTRGFLDLDHVSACEILRQQHLVYAHDEHTDFAQQMSLYESNASWLQRAQKKFFGKAVVGSDLHTLVSIQEFGHVTRTEQALSARRRAAPLWDRLRCWPWRGSTRSRLGMRLPYKKVEPMFAPNVTP